jgi:hypothetical protein
MRDAVRASQSNLTQQLTEMRRKMDEEMARARNEQDSARQALAKGQAELASRVEAEVGARLDAAIRAACTEALAARDRAEHMAATALATQRDATAKVRTHSPVRRWMMRTHSVGVCDDASLLTFSVCTIACWSPAGKLPRNRVLRLKRCKKSGVLCR